MKKIPVEGLKIAAELAELTRTLDLNQEITGEQFELLHRAIEELIKQSEKIAGLESGLYERIKIMGD